MSKKPSPPTMKKTVFLPDQFASGDYWTADKKAKIANAFVRFVVAGCPFTLFTRDLYHGLSSMWGHIAHFDRHGFYGEWFSSSARIARFLKHPDGYWMSGQGSPLFTLSDVETALQEWIRESWKAEEYAELARLEREAAELKQLASLKAKYEGVGRMRRSADCPVIKS